MAWLGILLIVGSCGGCFHSPREPRTFAVDALPANLAEALQKFHPGAILEGPVYRRDMDTVTGRYKTESYIFSFRDPAGGHFAAAMGVGAGVKLGVRSAETIPSLPAAEEAEFRQTFDPRRELQIVPPIRRLTDPGPGASPVYDFHVLRPGDGAKGIVVIDPSQVSLAWILGR